MIPSKLAYLGKNRSQVIGTLNYTGDFAEESSVGEIPERETLLLVLPALVRACDTCGDALDLGMLRQFTAWGGGEGVRLKRDEDNLVYTHHALVFSSTDFEAREHAVLPGFSGLPVLGENWCIQAAIAQLPEIIWHGIRSSSNNHWNQVSLPGAPEAAVVQRATMMALQVDVLLKGQGLPRGRVLMDFTEGSFRLWTSHTDDYLMVLQKGEDIDSLLRSLAIGEAFMLGGACAG